MTPLLTTEGATFVPLAIDASRGWSKCVLKYLHNPILRSAFRKGRDCGCGEDVLVLSSFFKSSRMVAIYIQIRINNPGLPDCFSLAHLLFMFFYFFYFILRRLKPQLWLSPVNGF